jgi:hypothetical protein
MGSLLAVALYKLMKFLNYEEVGGDQDKSGDEIERGAGGKKTEEA